MAILNILGFDPSMNNWGIAAAKYDTETGKLEVVHLSVTTPVLPTGKQVRQNSKDLQAAQQLYAAAIDTTPGVHAIFVEVPIGSQSARAMASYGMCVGILGGLRASGIPFYEVTPTEVKLAATGNKNATKKDMISWGTTLHPEASWPTYNRGGVAMVTEAKAEHMADALGAIYAGLNGEAFKQSLRLMR